MSESVKTILFFGATGNIGRVVIEELSRSQHPLAKTFALVALTRDINSSSSKRLAGSPRVTVGQLPADGMDNPQAAVVDLGYEKGDIYGCFSCQGYVPPKQDTAQGIAIAEMCNHMNVSHLVYLSTNYGSTLDSGTIVFECKRQVEDHIKSKLFNIPHTTFLHPAQFMDNLLPSPTQSNFIIQARCLLVCHAFKTNPNKKHQLVSIRDIGIAGARAFEEPQNGNEVIDIAGDEIDMQELRQIYKEEMGSQVDTPLGFRLMTGFGRRFIGTPKGLADFFDLVGYNVDLIECKKRFPEIETFRQFLRRNSGKSNN